MSYHLSTFVVCTTQESVNSFLFRALCVIFVRWYAQSRRLRRLAGLLREDHYKHIMSADIVSARLPYAVITKVVATSRWKRCEVNGAMTFAWIKESASLSIRRRSLVLNVKGRFLSLKQMADVLSGILSHLMTDPDFESCF